MDAARALNNEFKRDGKASRGGRGGYGGRGGIGNSTNAFRSNQKYDSGLATAPPAHFFLQPTAAVQPTQPTPVPRTHQSAQTAQSNAIGDRGGPMDVDEVAIESGMANSGWATAAALTGPTIAAPKPVTSSPARPFKHSAITAWPIKATKTGMADFRWGNITASTGPTATPKLATTSPARPFEQSAITAWPIKKTEPTSDIAATNAGTMGHNCPSEQALVTAWPIQVTEPAKNITANTTSNMDHGVTNNTNPICRPGSHGNTSGRWGQSISDAPIATSVVDRTVGVTPFAKVEAHAQTQAPAQAPSPRAAQRPGEMSAITTTEELQTAVNIVNEQFVAGLEQKLKSVTLDAGTGLDVPTGLDASHQKPNGALFLSRHNPESQAKPIVLNSQSQTKPTILNVQFGVYEGRYIDKDWLETEQVKGIGKRYKNAATAAKEADDNQAYRRLQDVVEFIAEVVRCRIEIHDEGREGKARENAQAAAHLAAEAYGKYHEPEAVINNSASLDRDIPVPTRSDAQSNRSDNEAQSCSQPLKPDSFNPATAPRASPQVGQPAGFHPAHTQRNHCPQRKHDAIEIVDTAAQPLAAGVQVRTNACGYPKSEATQRPVQQRTDDIVEASQQRPYQQRTSQPSHQPAPMPALLQVQQPAQQDPAQRAQIQQPAPMPAQQVSAQRSANIPQHIPTSFNDPAALALMDLFTNRGGSL